MFIRYNETAQFWEYTNSGNASGPWTKLPVDYTKLTNLPPTSELPPNVALTDASNIFTEPQNIQFAGAGSKLPGLNLIDLSQSVDSRKFRVVNSGSKLYLQALSDDGLTSPGSLVIDRNGKLYERNRLTAIGDWQDVPFNAANFYSDSGGTWTVGSSGVARNRYTLIGKTMLWSVYILWSNAASVVSGTVASLIISIPGGFTASPNQFIRIAYATDGSFVELNSAPIGNELYIAKIAGGNFGTNPGFVNTFIFEIL